ncbi:MULTISPECIES: efflux RND transporter periplasmic adaptor subunit [unclassified Oceanobacter]|uniref:efflux RND transporter periplasmic adaptor subunit n=1 Tax=unclassified Oceanobacter TaxID=2620260 RepID=UPI0026E1A415|nr:MULTISPECIES: efflux RND transporter periplasmic adaptor subunit [unclassified Oceanobacter]MDO6683740.1 efflux RND transporter periplasmic adaptor subunit [Oceanobacter sp. 5_MG-2023]MDP2507273.1 efflux RND transporter periplasmic adaptor subunit [Oceanobacter sp. 3_MG-2023]MDP2549430.1 efflux RND transporter periplasmic adaptor subunit [Oceanobacter sp. 4_MG-2023]
MGRHQAGSGYLKLPLLAALVLTLSACQEEQQASAAAPQMPPTGVDVVQLAPQSFELTDTLAGRVTAYRVAEIRPQVSGIILKRFFNEGATVKAGDKLYQIDPTLYEAELASARAQLAVAEANAYSARLKAERYKELSRTSAISRQDVDDSEALWKQSEAQIKLAEAAVRSAEINLGYTKITAPISGVISRSSITEGALVSDAQDSALTVIRQISPIYVDVQSPATKVMGIKSADVSQDVSLSLQDGTTFAETGKIQFTDVGVDQGTGTVNIRTLFENTDGLLLPGMFVRANIAYDQVENALLVPQQAVSRNPDSTTTVMVVGADNVVQPRAVVVTRAVGDQWLIQSGLQADEQVVVAGLQKIKAGATVAPNLINAPAEQ